MSYEVAVALWAIEYRAAAAPIRAFVHATQPLHWSSPTTARIAGRYAHDLSTLAALSVPPLCEDARAWKQSGFQVIPSDALSLVRRVEAIEPQPIPPARLAPYERAGDAACCSRRSVSNESSPKRNSSWASTIGSTHSARSGSTNSCSSGEAR